MPPYLLSVIGDNLNETGVELPPDYVALCYDRERGSKLPFERLVRRDETEGRFAPESPVRHHVEVERVEVNPVPVVA